MNRIIIAILFGLLVNNLTLNAQQTGQIRDERDGRFYKTIMIGDQTWMAENLAFKLNAGCWAHPETDYIENEKFKNYNIYGYLYNWESAQKACPVGWHLPTEEEWIKLTDQVGGKTVAAMALKSKVGWVNNGNGNNESGFNALAGGFVVYNTEYKSSRFMDLGNKGIWWNASENANGYVSNYFVAAFNLTHVFKDASSKENGYSIRCIQNINTNK